MIKISITTGRPVEDASSALLSEPCIFLVRPMKKRFLVHSRMLSRHSTALVRLMNGEAREAATKMVELPDIEPDIFHKFIVFCYIDSDLVSASTVGQPQLACLSGLGRKGTKRGSDGATKVESRTGQLSAADQPELQDTETPADLLCHVKLFALADMYDVSALKRICFSKSLRSLDHFTVEADTAAIIVELLRFLYVNKRATNSKEDALLRYRIVRFAALNVESLFSSQDFCEAITSGGDFVLDLMKQVKSLVYLD